MLKNYDWGSGCDSVGGAVTYVTRDRQFESSYRRIFKYLEH